MINLILYDKQNNENEIMKLFNDYLAYLDTPLVSPMILTPH